MEVYPAAEALFKGLQKKIVVPPYFEKMVLGSSVTASVASSSDSTLYSTPISVKAPFTNLRPQEGASIPDTAYLIELNDNNTLGNDINFSTARGNITVELSLTGRLRNAAKITAETSHGGDISLVIPSRQTSIDVRMRTVKGGTLFLALPRDFNGLLTLRSMNGIKCLSTQLLANAVILGNEGCQTSEVVSYRIHPKPKRSQSPATPTYGMVGAVSSGRILAHDMARDEFLQKPPCDVGNTVGPGVDGAYLSATGNTSSSTSRCSICILVCYEGEDRVVHKPNTMIDTGDCVVM